MVVVDPWRVRDFVTAHTSLSERTLDAYETDLRLFAEWVARSHVEAPGAVTRTLVRRYVASLSTRQFARRTIARKAAALRRYYRWALAEGLASTDPTIGLHVSSGPGRLPRVLDRRDLEGLLLRYGGHDPRVCTTCIGALAQSIVGEGADASHGATVQGVPPT